jgi:protein tyrosine/serine phosphatase
MTHPRKLPFDGIRNFRDFGGYAGTNGNLASARLFRSGHHALASDADLERLEAMNIAAVIDLRRPHERAFAPSRRWSGFRATLIENDDGDEGNESWEDFQARWDMTPESFRDYQQRYYARAPFLPRLNDLYARAFETIATADGAVLIHCAAGKDRTGVLVALIHAMAGVHRDDIIADYLLTNDPNWTDIATRWAKDIETRRGRAPGMDAMQAALWVDARYLDTALTAIAERHGNVETYLRDALGVDAKRRSTVLRRLFS